MISSHRPGSPSSSERELSQAHRARSTDRVSASAKMPMQNGGWVVAVEEAQQAAAASTKQPGRRPGGAALAVLLVLLRLAALCAAAASAALAAATLRRAPFRFLLAADAIVAVYSAFEAAAAAWEVARGVTLLPEAMQLWFDFAHDQGFGYMALAAAATAARDVAGCGDEGWTSGAAACVRADAAVGLGFAGFAFLALAALVTGFRVACFLATGARFPSPPPPPASY